MRHAVLRPAAVALAPAEAAALAAAPRKLFIGGEWRPAASGGRFDVEDPATGEVIAQVADAGPEDAPDGGPD